MKKLVAVIVVLLLFSAVSFAAELPAVGSVAPEFTLLSDEGK